MLDPDIPVWYRYLDREGATYQRLFYNVRLTTEPLETRFTDPIALSVAQAILPKRIDAVGERPGEVHLIEVAETIGLRSIGQLLTYHALWRQLRPDDTRALTMLLICANCGADETLAAAAAGIRIVRA
jgi:hypothetical protein